MLVLTQRIPSVVLFGTAGPLVVTVELPASVDAAAAEALARTAVDRAAEVAGG